MGWWDPGGPPSTGDPAPGERSPAAGGLRQRLQRRARCERHVRRLGRSGPGEKGTNDRVGARPPRCPDVRTVTASPAWRSRAPRTGDVTTMRRRTAELGRRRRPQPKTSIGPWATSQDNQPTNHHPSRWARVAASPGPGPSPGGGWGAGGVEALNVAGATVPVGRQAPDCSRAAP